uniref:Uncharacterized protein n=1 Tax=Vibrio splendidus TaxID=29497 RepID=A0A0H4A0G9_VIBSP|nr:hypothetical protein [Vibrio splendidus]
MEWRSIERASVHGLQSHYWCNPLSFNNSMHLGIISLAGLLILLVIALST